MVFSLPEQADQTQIQILIRLNFNLKICVDEQLVPLRGCCSFKQYVPSKPQTYGLKIWVFCDVQTS